MSAGIVIWLFPRTIVLLMAPRFVDSYFPIQNMRSACRVSPGA
jgi:hypothetical protein